MNFFEKGILENSIKPSFRLTFLQLQIWLNYKLFLKRLAKLAAEKASEDKSSVIRKHHVHAAASVRIYLFTRQQIFGLVQTESI